jgi:hypothetical protein
MLHSSIEKNHDLFNRALMLKGQVETAPNVPLPSALKFSALVYTGLQLVIVWLSRNVSWI